MWNAFLFSKCSVEHITLLLNTGKERMVSTSEITFSRHSILSVLKMYLHQHFGGSTGYGHEEAGGREALDEAFAEIFGAESAIVRAQVRKFIFFFFSLSFP